MDFMKNNCLKRLYILLVFTLGLCLTTVPLKAADPAETGPKSEPAAPKYTSLRRLPDDVTLATLSNGLTVIVQENHVAPVATVRCFVKNTGSAYEGKNLGAGLSHVLEHVVAGGTTTQRTEKEIDKIIDTFGGATNAFTSTDMTVFFIDCPAKNTMTAIELVADSMQHVKFEPAEFDRELKVVRRELADGEVDPAARAVGHCSTRRSTRPIPPAIRSSATSTCSTARRTRRSSTSTTSATCRTTRCSWSSAT